MAVNRLILDTDGGVDDAQALLLLIGAGRPPFAVTTVFGNVDLGTATDNILSVLDVAGVDIAVHKGSEEPIAQAVIDARYAHGDDGLGGAPRPSAIATLAGSDGVGFLIETLRDAAAQRDPVDLLMIGPLTNLAVALQREPGIVAGIGQLTVMGGTLYGRGNVTPAAEFNIFADPEAAAVVFAAAIETVVVPWEPCVAHALPGPEVDKLFAAVAGSDAKEFSLALARHARRHFGRRGDDYLCFVDPLAAAVAVEPAIVTRSVRASVDVALASGITRGMTVVDPSGRLGTPSVTLVEEVRLDRVVALYAASIACKPE